MDVVRLVFLDGVGISSLTRRTGSTVDLIGLVHRRTNATAAESRFFVFLRNMVSAESESDGLPLA